MKKIQSLFCACLGVMSLAALATTEDQTLYVDKFAASGGDGETMATAFNTIAAALAKAQTGWTILVAPGIYDSEEVVDDYGYTNRVYITKRVHLKSTGGKDVTHIVGKWSENSVHATIPGIGADAIRCIRITSGAYYSVVEGFTIRDGACHTVDDNASGYGGGVAGGGVSSFIVDCVVSNCTAVRGGALRDVTAVRSWITRNTGGSSAGRGASYVNCLISGNYGALGILMGGTFVNCTIAGNCDSTLFGASKSAYKIYNCVFENNFSFPGSGTPLTGDGNVISAFAENGSLKEARDGGTLGNSVLSTGGCGYNFFAPLVNDWRLLPTSSAIGLGKASYLSDTTVLPYQRDNVDYFKDVTGTAIPSTGTINAGCIQSPAPAPAAGAVQFEGPSIANGQASAGPGLYAFSDEYPAQFNVKPVLADNERPVRVERNDAAYDLFPQMDDSVWVATPPIGIVSTNSFVVTTNIIYVAPSGNDANTGRLAASPKKTLQAAVDATTESAVIVAAEGTYDEGGKVRNGVSNRVYIAYVSKRYLRIVGAGRGKSIIKGAADLDNPTGVVGDGRGPKACRCVCMGAASVVQGFTLTEGFSGYDSGNPGADDGTNGSTRGGAFTIDSTGSSRSVNKYLYDCDITACGANMGAAAYCGTLVRCHIYNCRTDTRGGLRYANLYSCLVDGATSDFGEQPSLYNGNCTAFQCTFSEKAGDGDVVAASITGFTNCVMRIKGGKTFAASKNSNGANVMDGEASNATYAQHVMDNGGFLGDSLLKDADGGDYRPITCSPAVGGGALIDDLYRYYCSDFNGNPVLFHDGKPTAGAFHTTVQGVIVPAARYGSFTSPAAMTNGVDEGETLAITLANATRPCAGFVVDGVTNLTDDTTYTFTGGACGALTETVTIAPVYLPHWYVDAVNGNDASNGFSRVSAKKTLKGLMDLGNSLYSGDTVHVAEGVYDEGEMTYSGSTIGTRVVVPNGVTLLADGKRENTIIEGKTATGGGDDLGNGSGAVRCVVLANHLSVIKGFTLRNGHTLSVNDGDIKTADYTGGGVFTTASSVSVNAAQVIDCVITNCCANRGGAGCNRIDYINCLFTGNSASTAGSAIYGLGAVLNCVFTGNRGATCVQASGNVVNCTFFDNPALDGSYGNVYDISIPSTGSAVYNTVVKGKVYGNTTAYLHASNCVFTTGGVNTRVYYDDATRLVDESLLVFSPKGEPLSSTHPVVDKAEMSFLSRFTRMNYEKDALGGQRIYNDALDVGAVEYDWRPVYAQTLGGGCASVGVASSNVVWSASGDAVNVRSGELSMTLTNDTDRKTDYSIPVEVSGAGTLTVTHNGEPLAVLTASDGATVLAFKNSLAENSLLFQYDGTDAGATIGKFNICSHGFMVILR